MVVEVNLPPVAAAAQTRSNSSVRDFARMIASLVALSAANIRASRSFCSSVLAFSSARSKFSSANETLSGEPLQQFGEFRRERVLLERNVDHDADHPPLNEQREGRAGLRAVVARAGVETPTSRVGEIVVGDAGPSRADRPAADARAFRDALR